MGKEFPSLLISLWRRLRWISLPFPSSPLTWWTGGLSIGDLLGLALGDLLGIGICLLPLGRLSLGRLRGWRPLLLLPLAPLVVLVTLLAPLTLVENLPLV